MGRFVRLRAVGVGRIEVGHRTAENEMDIRDGVQTGTPRAKRSSVRSVCQVRVSDFQSAAILSLLGMIM